MDDDAGECVGPDGSVIRYDAGPIDDGVDGGIDSSTSCVVGTEGCECEEGTSRECEGGSAVGACSPGTQRCVEGSWAACDARVDPAAETCNGEDDDCNGTPDDGSARTSCGTAPRALATGCSGGGCFVETCADGFLDCDSEFENGCESALGTPAACSSCGDVCGWACDEGRCNDAVLAGKGNLFSMIVRRDRSVALWGNNADGQFGDGTRGVYLLPTVSTLANVDDVVGGFQHMCALIAGEIWCSGDNTNGAVGDGVGGVRTSPTRVFSNARDVAAGAANTCAVANGGQVWCWGFTQRSREPSRVQGASLGSQVAVGADHACVLTTSGTVRCWGVNNLGVLGNGMSDGGFRTTTPVTVVDVSDARQLTAGDYVNCVLRESGTVWCWGGGAGVQAARPTLIPGLDDVVDVDAGGYRACAIRTDDSLWCWGNSYVGDGSSETRDRPVRVLEDVASVAVSSDHTCAVLKDGGVRCWGNNDYGQLGTGGREPALVPVAVPPPG